MITPYTLSMISPEISSIKIGSAEITKVYQGAVEVWTSVDEDLEAFLTATAIPEGALSDALESLIASLKETELWDKCHAAYPFVGGNSTAHKFNLKSPLDVDASGRLVYNDSPTHDANGMTVDHVNDRANTKIVPVAEGFEDTTGFSYGFYSRTDISFNGYILGCYPNAFYYGDSGSQYISNGAGYVQFNGATSLKGTHIINRAPGNITSIRYIKNGALKEEKSSAFVSYPNTEFLIGSILDGETYYYPEVSVNFGFVWIGEGLTPTEEADLSSIITAFQTALGRLA